MKLFIVFSFLFIFLACKDEQRKEVAHAPVQQDSSSSVQVIKGPAYITSIQFKNDYPTHETENKLYDELDFQRACQAYIGTIPIVVEKQHRLPHGYPYWQMLSDIINKHGVGADEKSFISMLKSLGIEIGKPFHPSLHQKIILTDAADIGFRMAQSIAFGRKYDSVFRYADTHWKLIPQTESRQQFTNELDARTLQWMMLSPIINDSFQYNTNIEWLATRKDKEGEWFEGSKYYQLHIPSNIPASSWTLTVFDNNTNDVIKNDEPRSLFDSRKPTYLANSDGSVDLFFGTIAPSGEGTNWIRTLPNKGWFAYLALSHPTVDLSNRKWQLGDIEIVDEKIWKGHSK